MVNLFRGKDWTKKVQHKENEREKKNKPEDRHNPGMSKLSQQNPHLDERNDELRPKDLNYRKVDLSTEWTGHHHEDEGIVKNLTNCEKED